MWKLKRRPFVSHSICIRMVRGFCEYLRRYQFLKHFSELTPWPTMRCEHTIELSKQGDQLPRQARDERTT